MSSKTKRSRVHPNFKTKYRVSNWPDYDRALIERGNITIWLSPDAIDYVNAHGTATEAGDIAESLATEQVLGSAIPISSTKGHTGHTLGACGSVEAIFCIAAMTDGFVPQTRNLEEVDPRCAPLEFVRDQPREADVGTVMTNNFAFGGINTSLIFRRM